jgi:2-(1,2-epoxy-1,2-dihydrophenyl)acetyl-CoA isomerase
MALPPVLAPRAGVAQLDVTGPWDLAWAERFRDQVSELHRRPGLRAVVVTSSGSAFGVGGDVRPMLQAEDVRGFIHELASIAHEGFEGLMTLPVPVVTRVQGVAAGMAFSLVLASDIVVASRAASFTTAYARIGITPDGGMSWTLPRLVGPRRAIELLTSARLVDAEEAERLGLVTVLVQPEELDAAVETWLDRLTVAPTAALGRTKQLVLAAAQNDLRDHLQAEATAVADLVSSPTGAEGISAFIARRPPEFPAC